MELTGADVLPVPRERVWEALLDPAVLKASIPGCESVEALAPGSWRVVVIAAVGPVKARFAGRLQQRDAHPPERCTLSFEGDGGVAGFARGSAEVDLSEAGDGAAHTRLAYRARVQIGGRLAQIGSRLIDATAGRMSAEFFARFRQALSGPVPPAPGAAAVTVEAPPALTAAALPHAGGEDTAVRSRGMVTIHMPQWVWVYTVTAIVLLVAWLAAR